ncbi:PREDICTED: serine/threonine-protein kinase prpf4B isoform X3 [Populus euphratica]|uniref:non-specific serine/threonine protein kinase n=1 Tax=Populus euphratica TaxID=75702 RepID=A0AAJ6TC22_POPEU|nr:PREDICTED: serine/threonine-protein kinase prpf4B isoform X3 [Populus euphratica]XP_011008122.1 PREDICTED: serine/threonine-protein kinase prpf4B isoform X3 [Populus euphratica]XP_011008130.1 PREDICTED: serine/threonine-protein kinase prpf4B isoform X3 [Populus euphratica]
MASDSDASRRKHRRSSSDDEAEKSSKRHKHRHHHHRHRHCRSKKHGEDTKQGGEEIVPATLPPPVPVANSNGVDNDDVEEGEILEEEGSGGVDVEANELHEEVPDSQNLGFDKSDIGSVNNEVCLRRDSRAELRDELVSKIDLEDLANGNLGREYHKDDKKRHVESRSPSKRSNKRKTNPDINTTWGDDSKLRDCRKSSSSERSENRHKRAQSPSCERYHYEIHSRSRSMSRDLVRERSHSRSHIECNDLLTRKGRHDRVDYDSDGKRMSQNSRDLRHGSRDSVKNVDRESSVSYNKSFDGEDRYHNKNSQDRESSKEREKEREQQREKEQERCREREVDRVRRRGMEHERSWESFQRREMEHESRESDHRREKDRYGVVDWERRRDKERGRSRDRVEGIDRKRQKETDLSKHKNMHRASDRDRDREREREKDRDRYRERDRVRDHDRGNEQERERRNDRDREKSRDKSDSEKFYNINSNSFGQGRDNLKRDEDEQDDFEKRMALKLAEQEEEDLNRIKEESRKRREAILEKYRNKHLHQQNESQSEDADKVDKEPLEGPVNSAATDNVAPETLDARTDGADVYVAETSFSVGKSPSHNGRQVTSERTSGAAGLGEGSPKSERSDEKYCDDIFGETPVGVRKSGKGEGLPIVRSGLHDNWDDPVGYYSYRFGEVLDGRYEIVAAHGKGVFSTVVRAKDLKAGIDEPEEVAIKIIRNNETMRKAGDTEVSILKKLAGQDPENKRHCVRFLSSFKYRNHLCLVFESLHMNLREVLKKFGRDIGLKLTAVRAYAKQLFIALKHLRNCGVLHSDIKPDNMLVNEAKNVLKLCDFGNAMFSGKNEITPYLVSRFYRAPEIILGLTYDHPMDVWSVGCCLYELYTGKVLFPGSTNNDMLRLHMELKGPFPKKMLKKGAFVDQHFDHDLNFHATEEDPVTKKIMKKIIVNIKAKDIGSIISGSPGEDPKMLANFKDLLEKLFVLDPEKRMTVNQALAHPLITVFGMVDVKTGDMWSTVLFTGGVHFSGVLVLFLPLH